MTLEELPSSFFYQFIFSKLQKSGVPDNFIKVLTTLILILAFVVIQILLDWIIRNVMIRVLKSVERNASSSFVRFLFRNKTFEYTLRLIPFILSLQVVPVIFAGFPGWISFISAVLDIILMLGWILVIRSVFISVRDYFRIKPAFLDKPLDSYLQVFTIVLYIVGFILVISRITGKNPSGLLGAMGAASAILMLVFKDTILGFVASIQVSTNDMVRVGDWIEMPKYGADGDVIEINLNTVKVQNWDKTITTVPTYYLITDSFKNWRGMHATGGRRIKRSIFIKMSSIHFVSPDELAELRRIQLLKEYIDEKDAELKNYNSRFEAEEAVPVNERRMTNVGLFRKYANAYVESHPQIRKDMTLLVRQLQPTEHGLPLELYMFTSDTRWAIYEGVMSDIFDHLLASVRYFNLEVFEAPSSDDIRRLSGRTKA